MNTKSHWESIHQTKASNQVSWYQEHSLLSLQYIANTGIDKTGQIIDIGGGISTLVDDLLANHYGNIHVLDISEAALQTAQKRLGSLASKVNWIVADITQAQLPNQFYDVWHDRAVFHFLTKDQDRQSYIQAVKNAVKPGGHVIVATFANDGPEKCSGLDVVRYEPQSLHGEFGADFELLDSTHEEHHTPFGTDQKFIYCYCRKN
jgi:2-polyprenyl-3-methyl-5-hydroxy-6-metoxy-1,4-benzoquinol methylase